MPGLPDWEFILSGNTYYVEAKYVSKLPVKATSKVLKHSFTPEQYKQAILINMAGGRCAGLIGIGKEAYVIPPQDFSKRNFSMIELSRYCTIAKVNGSWEVSKLIAVMDWMRKKI